MATNNTEIILREGGFYRREVREAYLGQQNDVLAKTMGSICLIDFLDLPLSLGFRHTLQVPTRVNRILSFDNGEPTHCWVVKLGGIETSSTYIAKDEESNEIESSDEMSSLALWEPIWGARDVLSFNEEDFKKIIPVADLYLLISVKPKQAAIDQYVLWRPNPNKNEWFALPFPNIYTDSRLCAGHDFDDILEAIYDWNNTIPIMKETLRYFLHSGLNEDLWRGNEIFYPLFQLKPDGTPSDESAYLSWKADKLEEERPQYYQTLKANRRADNRFLESLTKIANETFLKDQNRTESSAKEFYETCQSKLN